MTHQDKSKDALMVNKLAGGILAASLFVMVIGLVGEMVYHEKPENDKGYPITVKVAEAASTTEAPKEGPIAPLLAKADAAKGEAVFKKCASCHDVAKGGPNKTGPNLWGVVGRPQGKHEGFAYSDGLKAAKDNWDFEHLSRFIANPKAVFSSTKMNFAGLAKAEDRADLLLYLNKQSDQPLALPK